MKELAYQWRWDWSTKDWLGCLCRSSAEWSYESSGCYWCWSRLWTRQTKNQEPFDSVHSWFFTLVRSQKGALSSVWCQSDRCWRPHSCSNGFWGSRWCPWLTWNLGTPGSFWEPSDWCYSLGAWGSSTLRSLVSGPLSLAATVLHLSCFNLQSSHRGSPDKYFHHLFQSQPSRTRSMSECANY